MGLTGYHFYNPAMHKYKFKDLRNHCFDLAHFCIYNFHQRPEQVYLRTVAEWLRLASRIKKVQLESLSKERSRSGGDDIFQYIQDEKEFRSTDQVSNMILFSLIWSAYDFLVSGLFVNPQVNDVGKVLHDEYEPHKNLIGFNGLVRDLKHHLRLSALIGSRKIHQPLRTASRSSRGIYIVHQIRDQFAHLKDQFPAGMDFHEKSSLEESIIKISSRLILLSMQMLFLTALPEDQEYIDFWWKSPPARERKLIHSFLRTVHLQ